MPWKPRKRKCKQKSTGKTGTHVVVKVKKDGGTEQESCHTSEDKAKAAVRARYANEGKVMKVTKRQLKRIIREEKARLLRENPEDAAGFEDIMGQLSELLDEAFELCGRDRTAEVYWYNTMKGCIDGRATMHTMENTLEEMAEGSGDEDMMEMGYNDGQAGRPAAHPENEFYMINYEDGVREA